jgi:two-component system OmpR family sensor kinase
MRLLLVEDDALIGDGLQQGLRREGYTVDRVREAEDAELALAANPYAMLLLDLGRVEAEPATVPGDGEHLRILLGNLVENAIRYTPAGGRIDLSVTRQGGWATLAVSDNGPGIPEEERARVLDRFCRGAHPDGVGSGLGLSIVQRIADQHGAALELDSGPGGAGLTARIRFPETPAGGP